MIEFQGIHDSASAARRWIIKNEDNLPEHLKERLMALTDVGVSPVDLMVNFVEAVYANQDDFPSEAKDVAAASALVGEQHNFHSLAQENRGSNAAKILRNQAVAKKNVPEPKDDFVKPEDPVDEPDLPVTHKTEDDS